MKLKFVAHALVGVTAGVLVTRMSEVSSTELASNPTDTTRAGLSGKLVGPFFKYLNNRPFTDKVNGRIGQYLIGFWPAERKRVTSMAYQNPSRFFEVTAENQDTPVSEHFRVRDFLTKGQVGIWPK